jgi:hypothetical protein
MRITKSFAVGLSTVGASLLLGLSLGAARIASLEARVAGLEKKAANAPVITFDHAAATPARLAAPNTASSSIPLDVPPGSHTFRFNGSMYYVVPLLH